MDLTMTEEKMVTWIFEVTFEVYVCISMSMYQLCSIIMCVQLGLNIKRKVIKTNKPYNIYDKRPNLSQPTEDNVYLISFILQISQYNSDSRQPYIRAACVRH